MSKNFSHNQIKQQIDGVLNAEYMSYWLDIHKEKKKKKIVIDWKEIEISYESYQELKRSLLE